MKGEDCVGSMCGKRCRKLAFCVWYLIARAPVMLCLCAKGLCRLVPGG